MIFSGAWFSRGSYQMLFKEIGDLFVSYSLEVKNGEASIKGLYLKTDKFALNKIAKLEYFLIQDRRKNITNTLFPVDQEHFVLGLSDGRSFYFSGGDVTVKEMLLKLVSCVGIKQVDEPDA